LAFSSTVDKDVSKQLNRLQQKRLHLVLDKMRKKAVGKQIQTVVLIGKPSISWKSSKVAEGAREQGLIFKEKLLFCFVKSRSLIV
jgi:hypothetical protein